METMEGMDKNRRSRRRNFERFNCFEECDQWMEEQWEYVFKWYDEGMDSTLGEVTCLSFALEGK
jgi:hypothetical protein